MPDHRFCPAITRRQSLTLALTKASSALASDEGELWLGARDAETGQHHLEGLFD